MVAHPYGVTLSNDLSDTFAIIHAEGAQGAVINNASGSRLDFWGNGIVPYVTPYEKNQISIDPSNLDLNVELSATEQEIIPRANSATLVKFDTKTGRSLLFDIRMSTGNPLQWLLKFWMNMDSWPDMSLRPGRYLPGDSLKKVISALYGDQIIKTDVHLYIMLHTIKMICNLSSFLFCVYSTLIRKNMKRIFFIPLFLILLPKLAVAGPDDYVPSQIAVNTSTLPGVVIGPADAHTYPRVIGELAGTSNQYVFNGGAIALMRGQFTPALPKIGSITYTFHQGNSRDSSDFDIYDIGVSGLGIIIGMAGYWPATPLVPINSSGIYIDPVGANTNPNTYNGATASFGARLFVAFVATGRLPNGYITIPTVQLGTILLEAKRTSLNNKGLTAPVMLNGGRIQVQSQTCTMGQKNYVVPLNTVYQSQFTSLYKEIQGGKIDIHLQCPDGTDVYATLTDASQPVNRTDILTLSSESTAKGFGIRLYKDSDVTAISYGEDFRKEMAVNGTSPITGER